MKLSLVVAAYNIENYIGICLRSIFQQDAPLDSYEVVVVNDGSKDNTLNIIKSFAEDYPNLIIINQINKGLSAARNAGLKIISGDYVLFVDGDDALTDNSIQTILSYCIKFPNADFLTFDRIHYEISKGTKEYCCSFGKKHLGFNLKKKNDLYYKPLNREQVNSRIVSGVVWLNIYKTAFLRHNNLYFLEGILHEDDEFKLRSFFYTKEMRFIPFAHYRYSALRPGSITAESQIPKLRSVNSWIRIIENWNIFEKQYAKTKADFRFINSSKNFMYSRLLGLSLLPKDNELYSLYILNKQKWRKEYRNTFKKSINLTTFLPIPFIRFILTLTCPKFIKYTELKTLKRLIKGKQ